MGFRAFLDILKKVVNSSPFQATNPVMSRLRTNHFPKLVYVILWVPPAGVSVRHVKESVLMASIDKRNRLVLIPNTKS